MPLFASLRERFAEGQPPLRVSELASVLGYSRRGVQKLLETGALGYVRAHERAERRIPVQEAARIARDLGVPLEP